MERFLLKIELQYSPEVVKLRILFNVRVHELFLQFLETLKHYRRKRLISPIILCKSAVLYIIHHSNFTKLLN